MLQNIIRRALIASDSHVFLGSFACYGIVLDCRGRYIGLFSVFLGIFTYISISRTDYYLHKLLFSSGIKV